MDNIGLIIVASILFIYALGVTVALVVSILNNLTKSKRLRLMEQELTALRAQKAAAVSNERAAARTVAQTPVAAPAQTTVQSAAPAVPRPAVPVPQISVKPANTYAYTAPLSREEARAAASSAKRPQAATPSPAPAPAAAPAVPKKPREKVKFSSINISFAVGVLLITIVGAVFISSSWNFMNDAVRAGVLIGVVALVFFLSYLSGKVLKLRQTGFAFYTLGSLLLPVVTCGIGAMSLFGDWFSFKGDGAAIVAAFAALLFGIAGYVGVRIYKSGAYYGIMYLGFTWTLLFVASQFAYRIYDRVGCCFLALSAASLVTTYLARKQASENIRFFKIYSQVITYISTGAIVFAVWNVAYIPVLSGLGLIIVTHMLTGKKWTCCSSPAVMVILSIYASTFADHENNDHTYPLLVYALCIVVFFILLKAIKRNTYASDLILTVSLMGGILAGAVQYRPEIASFYLVTLCVSFTACLIGGYASLAKGQNKIVSSILAALTAFTAIVFVYSVGTGIFYGDSLVKALNDFHARTGVRLVSKEHISVATAAPSLAFTVALTAYILCNVYRRKHHCLRIASYAFMVAGILYSVGVLSGQMIYLAMCVSAITRSVRMCIREKETATKVSRVLSAVSHYTAMVFMPVVFARGGSGLYMLCLLIVFASMYIRVVRGGSKWQRFITPPVAAFISFYAVSFANIPETSVAHIEMGIFGLCLLIFYVFTEVSKLRNSVTDLMYPAIFFAASLTGSIRYNEDKAATYLVTVIFIFAAIVLMALCLLRKSSHTVAKVTASVCGALFSSVLFYSAGTYIFCLKTPELPLLFCGALSLAAYIVCATVIRKIKGKSMAAYSSYAFFASTVYTLVMCADSSMPVRIASAALLVASFAAVIISRYLSEIGKHPDIMTVLAIVFGLCSSSYLISLVFKGDISNIGGIVFSLLILAAGMIPQIKSHEVLSKYTVVTDIASSVLGCLFFFEFSYANTNPWAGLLLTLLILVLLYLKKNTVTAILPLLIASSYAVRSMAVAEGYCYVLSCIFGILLIGLGLMLHKKPYSAPLYIDYITYVSLLFPLNIFNLSALKDVEAFAVFLTIALILISHAVRFPKEKAILLSISTSFMCLAILNLQIVKDLPDIISGEVVMFLILLDVFMIRNVIKPGKDSTMRVIWIIAVAFCLAIEGISAAATGEILDLLITGIVSVAIFIYAFIAKDKSWFLLSIIAIIAIAVYLSATFWASKAWLVYLLVVGILLISMAAINEYGKRKAELRGEQSEGAGAGVKRFFEEWKW